MPFQYERSDIGDLEVEGCKSNKRFWRGAPNSAGSECYVFNVHWRMDMIAHECGIVVFELFRKSNRKLALCLKAVRDDRQESPNALSLRPLSLLSDDRSWS